MQQRLTFDATFLGMQLPVTLLYDYQSIAAIVEYINTAVKEASASQQPGTEGTDDEASPSPHFPYLAGASQACSNLFYSLNRQHCRCTHLCTTLEESREALTPSLIHKSN